MKVLESLHNQEENYILPFFWLHGEIKECYEPHYEHYKEEFGKTILGFFSDEPEIGNVADYSADSAKIGNPNMPLPWSEEMPALMEEKFGKDYETKLISL